jgi:serine/threonine protein kinase
MTVSQAPVAGRYRLDRPLGSGGMGRVWLARDDLLDREVAIKEVVLPFGLTDDEREELLDRKHREAHTAARISHPNVVRVYDVIRSDDQPWIVMEYVRSRSLHQVIREDSRCRYHGSRRSGSRCCPRCTTPTGPAWCTAT